LLMFSLYATRVLQLQYGETFRDAEQIRPSAEAAARMPGAAGEGGRKLLEILAGFPTRFRSDLGYILTVLSCLPLVFRRRFPEAVHLTVLSFFVATMWFTPTNGEILSILLWVSMYSFAAHSGWLGRKRFGAILVSALSTLLLLSGIVQNRAADPSNTSVRDKAASLVVNGLFVGSAVALGLLVRRLKLSLDTQVAQTETLRLHQLELERIATLNERVRIAREVHDVVAHHVSVMGLHAGAARMTLGSQPSMVGESLATIERASRDAVSDLHRLLSFLRSDRFDADPTDTNDRPDIPTPQPTLDTLPTLFEKHREAGFDVVARISADLRSVSPAIELAVFRIVQEALTNSRKHGHSTDETIVDIWSDSDRMRIKVENIPAPTNLRPTGPFKALTSVGKNHGIRGMRERALLHGGEFSAGPSSDGGFIVRAVFPLRA
jgi:signal transduction histidine kinase